MIGWLQLTDQQRKAVIDEAEQVSGITAKAIEKDWWVTLVLKALFQSAYKNFMVFKGGTSLSKGFGLIARFSEDIDIALDSNAFGVFYTVNPSKSIVEKLKKAGCDFTSYELRIELEKQLNDLGVPAGTVRVIAADIPDKFPDTDPQTLFIRYKSLYDANAYLADEVKVEVSVRSAIMPFTRKKLQTLLNQIKPNPIYNETAFEVDIVEPRKTFIEKLFLLHEEFGKPDPAKIRWQRMSRHLYDIHKMLNTGILAQVLADHELFNSLLQHREWYSRISWVDYKSMIHTKIAFLPVEEIINDYKNDYAVMCEQMIYEENPPAFDTIIANLKNLQVTIRSWG
jgi:Nucleotidyl transferase AbiEii toxin, Type IV TA system